MRSVRWLLCPFILVTFGAMSTFGDAQGSDQPGLSPVARHRVIFHVSSEVKMQAIRAAISEIVGGMTDTADRQFAAFAHSGLKIDATGPEFAYKDVYFDTSGGALRQAHQVYRLHFVWDDSRAYRNAKYFWFLSQNFPQRCSLQFNADGFDAALPFQVRTTTARAELARIGSTFGWTRAASGPFPEAEAIQVATSGEANTVRLAPAAELARAQANGVAMPAVAPVLAVETMATTVSLDVKSPWGQGENPDRAFQIAIGLTRVLGNFGAAQAPTGDQIVEINVETDSNLRNRLRQISLLSERDFAVDTGRPPLVVVDAARISQVALTKLDSDLSALRRRITSMLVQQLGSEPVGAVNVYEALLPSPAAPLTKKSPGDVATRTTPTAPSAPANQSKNVKF